MSIAASETQAAEVFVGHDGPAGQIGPDEELITLAEATWHLPKVDGRKVAASTLWRWCRQGPRGKFLGYVRVGRRICTTREALLRFFTELEERVEPDRYARPRRATGFIRTGPRP